MDEALESLRERIVIDRVVDYAVVVNTGREFSDGAPVFARIWVPPNQDTHVAVGDGGQTYARLGERSVDAPDYALSVRRELLEYMPVREIRGQIVIIAKMNQVADAVSMLADSCVALDVAVIVANHLRPKL